VTIMWELKHWKWWQRWTSNAKQCKRRHIDA